MSNMPEYNFPAFNKAAFDLEECGFVVENPATKGVIDGWTWSNYLRYDLRRLLDCEGVATLDGWEGSRGALLEVHVASQLEMPVRSVSEWISWDWRKGEAA